MAPASSMLLQLPAEIATAISANLPNRDVKNLRLTCKALCAVSQLRLNRVFLSANPRNIDVFWAIVGHEVLRKQIIEIIWDDARLRDDPGPRRSAHPASPSYDPSFDPEFDDPGEDEEDGDNDDAEYDKYEEEDAACPRWFRVACRQNVQDLIAHKGNDVDRPDHVARAKLVACISLARSWRYYQKLLQQQREVLETDADADAFSFGLQRFPALQRVTITPAAHGWRLFMPLYQTPMIRAFPPGFNYPIPGWPLQKQTQRSWQDTSENEKNTWRGFRITMRVLAAASRASNNRDLSQQQRLRHGITEIVVDVNQLLTGLNARVFDEECTEQRNLDTILRRPNFRRLDLALAVGGLGQHGWRPFRSGCLRRTLAAAPDLEHVSFVTDLEDYEPDDDDPPSDGLPFIPLHEIFPVDAWTRLRHFGLSRFPVRQYALVSFLEALPTTLRSIELSFLFFVEGNLYGLVADMRDKLEWRERPANQRPRVAIGLPAGLNQYWRGIWADRPVERFLYHDGPNPFQSGRGNQIPHGIGAVVKDAFDPAYERPWTDYMDLVRLGYVVNALR